jgi:hypothetical protein
VAIRQIWGQVRERMVDVFTSTLIKNKTKFFFTFKEIQKGSVAKSYITNVLLIYG